VNHYVDLFDRDVNISDNSEKIKEVTETKIKVTVRNIETGAKYYVKGTNNQQEVLALVKQATDKIMSLRPLFISDIYKQLMDWRRDSIEDLVQNKGWRSFITESFATEEGIVGLIIEREPVKE